MKYSVNIINIDLFNFKFILCLGKYDENELNRIVREEVSQHSTLIPEPQENAKAEGVARCWDFGQRQIIWMEEFDIPLLTHELTHATNYALDDIGIKSGSDCGNEVQAYIMESAMRSFINLNDNELPMVDYSKMDI